MTCWYLVRHAQTVWNGENRLQGHSDVPLSPEGRRQAKRLAVFFGHRRLEGIFTSQLQRSRRTAEAIAAGNTHRVSPVVSEELAEMHLGVWEGLTPEEIDARYGGAYRRWSACPSSIRIPQAESLDGFRKRVRRAWGRLSRSRAEGDYVVVSHGGVIAALLADALEADYDTMLRRLRLDNAGITAVGCYAGVSHVLWINSTAHLKA